MRGASYLCRGSLTLGALCLALLAAAEVWGAAELQARKEADEMLCSGAKLLLQSSALHPHPWCWNAPTRGAGTSWRAWGTGKYAHMQQGWVWDLICNSNVVTEVDKFNYLETFKPGFWVQHSCVFVKNDHLLHLLCNDFHILNCHLSS